MALTYDALAEAGESEDSGRVEEHRVDPCASLTEGTEGQRDSR